jgi:hypothetical protein
MAEVHIAHNLFFHRPPKVLEGLGPQTLKPASIVRLANRPDALYVLLFEGHAKFFRLNNRRIQLSAWAPNENGKGDEDGDRWDQREHSARQPNLSLCGNGARLRQVDHETPLIKARAPLAKVR